MVVDCCKRGDDTLPLALLRHFGVDAVDLLVVTHPDRDHYRGLHELVGAVRVAYLWRYRGFHMRRQTLAKLCELHPGNRRYRDLLDAQNAILPLMEENRGFEVAMDTRPWGARGEDGYEVHCIAPCPADIAHESVQLHKLFTIVKDGIAVDDAVERFVLGQSGSVDGRGNPVSLAISIRWRAASVLLGGDVECADGAVHRGWSGIIETLSSPMDDRLRLLQGLQMVKVSHHGSKGAFSAEAWGHHASRGRVDVAVTTPFRGSDKQPPHTSTFQDLLAVARRVALTSSPDAAGSWDRITDGGWVQETTTLCDGDGAWVAVVFDGGAPPTVTHGRGGAVFTAA